MTCPTHDDILDPAEAKKIVEDGYDKLSEHYTRVRRLSPRDRMYIDILVEMLPSDARILDLGCGGGGPITKELASKFDLVGIDFSQNQIDLARKNVPNAEFHRMDMTDMPFEDDSFDAVYSFLAIIHVPRDEKPALFAKLHEMLKPGGIMLLAIGCDDWVSEPGDEFMGEPMYWSQWGSEKSLALIENSGFEILRSSIEKQFFNGEEERHFFILAKAQWKKYEA